MSPRQFQSRPYQSHRVGAASDPDRRRDLAAIHTGKKALALTDESYRDVLERLTGQRSASLLSAAQRQAVIEEFRRLGFKPAAQAKPKRAGRRSIVGDERARKIRALWLTLWHLGEVRDPSEDALAAFVKRMTKVDSLSWLSPQQVFIVTEALKDWCIRGGFAIDTLPEGSTTADYNRALVRVLWAKRTGKIDEYYFMNWWAKIVPCYMLWETIDAEWSLILVKKAGAWLRYAREGRARK